MPMSICQAGVISQSLMLCAPEVSTTNPIDLLQELFNLLEDYGPLWYTKETRDRVLRILVQSAH